MSKTEKLRFEANIPRLNDKQLQRTFIDLSRDLKAISDKSKVIDGGRIGMMYTTAEDATKWPVIDGVHQKNGYALCDGKTLSSRSNRYSKFNEAIGGLKLPSGPWETDDVELEFDTLPAGWDTSNNGIRNAKAYCDHEGIWKLRFQIRKGITTATGTTVGVVGVIFGQISSSYHDQTICALGGSADGKIGNRGYADAGNNRLVQNTEDSTTIFMVEGDVYLMQEPDWAMDNMSSYPIIQITEDAYEMGVNKSFQPTNTTGPAPTSFGGGGDGNFIPYSHLLNKNDMWGNAYYYGLKDATYDLGGLIHNGGYRVGLQSNGYRDNLNNWQSHEADDLLGAASVEVGPDGKILFNSELQKLDGSSSGIKNIGTLRDGEGLRLTGNTSGRSARVDPNSEEMFQAYSNTRAWMAFYARGATSKTMFLGHASSSNNEVFLDSYGSAMYIRSDTWVNFDHGSGIDVGDSSNYALIQPRASSDKIALRGSSGAYISFRHRNSSSRKGYVGFGSSSNNYLYFVTDSNMNGQFIYDCNTSAGYVHNFYTNYGNMEMGSANSTWWHMKSGNGKFYFDDRCEANGGFGTYSDRRAKKNLKKRKDKHDRKKKKVRNKLKKINTYEFQMKDKVDKKARKRDKDGKIQDTPDDVVNVTERDMMAGFLAQEFSEEFPEIVFTAPEGGKRNEDDPEGAMSLSYDGLLAVAYDAIKELSEENDELEAKVAKLESDVAEIKKALKLQS